MFKKILLKFCLICTLFITPLHLNAGVPISLPYFASIISKSEIANVRTGPSTRYPIKWEYRKNNWPVEVVATFENWRKIKDIYGDAGWIHETLLSGRRYGIVKGSGVVELYRLPIDTASIVLLAEDNVIAKLLECNGVGWCKVDINENKGWIQTSNLWGVKLQEVIN